MFCEFCGAKLPEGARLCPTCGRPLSHEGRTGGEPQGVGESDGAPAPAGPASDPTQVIPDTRGARGELGQPADAADRTIVEPLPRMPIPSPEQQGGFVPSREPRSRRSGGAGTAAIVLVILLVLGVTAGGFLWVRHQREQSAYEAVHSQHAVLIPLVAASFDTSTGTRLPVQVSGTDADGAVSEVQFVNTDGTGLALERGSYELSFPASPIGADGTLYSVPGDTYKLELGEDVASGSSVSLQVAQPLRVAPLDDLSSVTDEQLKAAQDYALRDGSHAEGVNPGVLVGAAQRKRDDAVAAKKAADEKAAQEQKAAEEAAARAKARHVTATSYEFDIPEYWLDSVTVQVSGDSVNIYSKDYPDRLVCWVEVVQSQQASAGDIGTSQIGKLVPLDSTRAVQVWATRWAFVEQAEGNAHDMDSTELTVLTGLQTGGASDGDPEGHSAEDNPAIPLIDAYISQNVTDTIKPRSQQ